MGHASVNDHFLISPNVGNASTDGLYSSFGLLWMSGEQAPGMPEGVTFARCGNFDFEPTMNARGQGRDSDIADGIRFAVDNDAKVVNLSLGGSVASQVQQLAVTYAHDKGVTLRLATKRRGLQLSLGADGVLRLPAGYKDLTCRVSADGKALEVVPRESAKSRARCIANAHAGCVITPSGVAPLNATIQ